MTQKAQEILKKMRETDQKRRILARLNDSKRRSQVMESINRADQDEPSRVGTNDQEMKILNQMNELQEFENENWSHGSL